MAAVKVAILIFHAQLFTGAVMQLAKLKKVDRRKYWKHKALDCAKWPAKPENIGESDNMKLAKCFQNSPWNVV